MRLRYVINGSELITVDIGGKAELGMSFRCTSYKPYRVVLVNKSVTHVWIACGAKSTSYVHSRSNSHATTWVLTPHVKMSDDFVQNNVVMLCTEQVNQESSMRLCWLVPCRALKLKQGKRRCTCTQRCGEKVSHVLTRPARGLRVLLSKVGIGSSFNTNLYRWAV